MPYIKINAGRLYYTEHGQGSPLVLLHAGWGLAVNGYAYQQTTLADDFRMIVPDRRGYGRSIQVDRLPAGFHWDAAADIFALLDALQIDRAFLWGHSDGAVIAALMAILQPQRVPALIFEGGHLYNRKTRSLALFRQLYADPDSLPEPAQSRMKRYHGPDRWRHVIRNWAGAWLELAEIPGDLYRGRLGEITCPTWIVLGGQDEHTPEEEMQEMARRIPAARLSIYPEAGHCVHDARLTRQDMTRSARDFFHSVEQKKA